MAQNKKQNYQIISLIGQGAYGQVYKARRKFTGQFVAIKSIKKKGKQDKDIKAMRQQIKILQKLKHQNIILLLQSFQNASEFILVTQLGQGQLFNIIQDDHLLQEDQIRKIAQQLVRALYYIHSNRITHRDMKPQNILMTSDGIIKLCDFGFARSMSYQTQVLTSLKGTPLYMAPEVVKQQPYNHTADLWSLGVILYQLATGSPPFTAPNLISLVQHISKDPIIYPQIITGDFKHFMKGLLNKDPKKRLGWPDLLHHPFIKQTQQQKVQRKRKAQKFTVWIDQNKISQQETSSTRSISLGGFEQKDKSINRDISPKRQVSSNALKVNDTAWNKYYNMANQQNGANTLRSDPKFLEQFLIVSQTGINQIIRVKDKKALLQISVTTLVLVLMKSKTPDAKAKKMDISKNFHIPTNLLNILKSLVKIDFGKQYIELISQIVKVIGLLSRITFQKTFGIQMVYIRSFIPLLPYLIKSSSYGTDQNYQTLVNNFLRTVGMFANNASDNIIRSFSFYKDLVQVRFIQESVQIIKIFYDNINVLKLFLQVFSALIHPICGDIQCFPWKKKNSSGLVEYIQFATMSICVKQSIINTLLESNWIQLFQRILQIEDQSALFGKMSIKRIILQSIRLSKDFTQTLLFQSKAILKYLFETLKGKDHIVSAFSCSILAQLLKYSRIKQRQSIFQQYIQQGVQSILLNVKAISLIEDLNNNYAMLGLYGSFTVLQQILAIQTNPVFAKENKKIIEFFQVQKNMQIFSRYLQHTDKNKIQQMRKVQGSNYGIHSVGLYDPLFFLLHRLFNKISKDPQKNVQAFATSLGRNHFIQRIQGLFSLLSSKTDLSPRGLVASLIFIGDLINTNIAPALINQEIMKAFIGLLKQNQLQSIIQWPANLGGGLSCLTIVFGNICKIFLSYLGLTDKQPQILRILYQYNLVQNSLNFAKHLNQQTISSIVSLMNHLIAFDKFQKSDKIQSTFAKQFIDSGGMALFNRFNLLNKDVYDASSIIQSCNLLSQLARGSKQFYPNIESIVPYEQISKLFVHPDTQVKSKVLNLVGNMCRHSSYFYQKLATTGIIKQCIKMCQDQDKTIKKFACVAIGNAGFHDSSLYDILRPAIPLLVSLIKDGQQKTRSNAVAALGNLARNSDILDKQFINSGANYQLVNVINNDKSLSAKKVSVMAIINLLSLPQSRNVLLNMKIETVLKKFMPPQYSGDVGLSKTCQKALQKIQK